LHKHFSGSTLQEANIISGRYLKSNPFKDMEFPYYVQSILCHGKFIYWNLVNPTTAKKSFLFSTLGMSGSYNPNSDAKNIRVTFILGNQSLHYCDPRNFGTFKYVPNQKDLEKKLKSLGPDPLQTPIDKNQFKEIITRGKRGGKTMAELLMDQSVIAGIGNYLKAEVLWLSKISPHRTANSLSDEERDMLYSMIRTVMMESYRYGQGCSLLTYRTLINDSYFHYPVGTLACYRRELDPEGNQILSEETKDKRTTWWSPVRQK
jgi:DNA-formamidopyrimidine glycosylase